MYKRFAERKGFKVTIVEEMTADFGIKSVEMRIDGPFAYGLLRYALVVLLRLTSRRLLLPI